MAEYIVFKKVRCEHPFEAINTDYCPSICNVCGMEGDEVGYEFHEVPLEDAIKEILATNKISLDAPQLIV